MPVERTIGVSEGLSLAERARGKCLSRGGIRASRPAASGWNRRRNLRSSLDGARFRTPGGAAFAHACYRRVRVPHRSDDVVHHPPVNSRQESSPPAHHSRTNPRHPRPPIIPAPTHVILARPSFPHPLTSFPRRRESSGLHPPFRSRLPKSPEANSGCCGRGGFLSMLYCVRLEVGGCDSGNSPSARGIACKVAHLLRRRVRCRAAGGRTEAARTRRISTTS